MLSQQSQEMWLNVPDPPLRGQQPFSRSGQGMRLYIGQLALSANHSHMYIVGSGYYYCIVGRWYYTAL